MIFKSSTTVVPDVPAVPRHIAVIMDGNGRWATKRLLPRVAGHVKGVEAVRGVVEACALRGVEYLTLFAFSSENWRRPEEEVSLLMRLFVTALEREVSKMHANNIRLKVVGDLSPLRRQAARDDRQCRAPHGRQHAPDGLGLRQLRRALGHHAGDLARWSPPIPACIDYTEEMLAPHLAMAYAPEPDLFIRTGGEERISNFLLWQLAYSELYFTDTYWPDFSVESLDAAIASYQHRERRFGRTGEQVAKKT